MYTDFSGEQAIAVHGHSNGEISRAVMEAMKSGIYVGGASPLETELAGKVRNVPALGNCKGVAPVQDGGRCVNGLEVQTCQGLFDQVT